MGLKTLFRIEFKSGNDVKRKWKQLFGSMDIVIVSQLL